jgi:DNA-binding transcriptional regulator YdaS (Cro superfamily)
MRGMSSDFSVDDRRRLAAVAGISEAYLYQCLTGRRDMGPAEARRVENVTGGELMRWHLCQKTWHRIWPELADAEGAPEVSPSAAA